MNHWRRGGLVILGSLLAGTGALGSFGAHYLGMSRDGIEFRLYLDGGAFLGRTASLQSIRVTVHQLRQGRLRGKSDDCVYRFDDTDHGRDRIECAERAHAPLNGVVYVRDTTRRAKGADGIEPMVCVRRCTARIPQRLRLEEADEDNH